MARGGLLRPLGFLVLMCGFGLRLDSNWQWVAGALIGFGTIMAVAGLWALHRGSSADAFVPGGDGR